MPGPLDVLTPRPSILQTLMGRLFPAPSDAESALAPEDIAGARTRALQNVGASLLRSGGPHPTGTTNVGQNVGQALQDANWPGVLDEAAQRAAAYNSIAGKAAEQRAIQAIAAKYPAQPNETPEQAMARFEQMVPDLISAGLYDRAKALQELIAKSRPGSDKYLTVAPGSTVLKQGPNGLEPAFTAPSKPTADQTLATEHQLYGEFTPEAATYRNVANAYRTFQSFKTEPASLTRDQGMLFSYMKMLDPTSTLLNGQRATEDNAKGVPHEISVLYNFLLGGTHRLSDDQRNEIVRSVQTVLKPRAAEFYQLYNAYRQRAQDAGVDPDRVVLDYFADIPGIQRPGPVSREANQLLNGGSR